MKGKVNMAEITKALKKIEKEHPFKVTARCDDGSAFLLPVDGNVPLGPPMLMTPKKILALAAIGPMPR